MSSCFTCEEYLPFGIKTNATEMIATKYQAQVHLLVAGITFNHLNQKQDKQETSNQRSNLMKLTKKFRVIFLKKDKKENITQD